MNYYKLEEKLKGNGRKEVRNQTEVFSRQSITT